jgi:hypothetical protein
VLCYPQTRSAVLSHPNILVADWPTDSSVHGVCKAIHMKLILRMIRFSFWILFLDDTILQYADDTILFLEHDIDKAINMKLILCIFEQLSGLKINFHKRELFCFGKVKDHQNEYK